jgi:hypothetical protein
LFPNQQHRYNDWEIIDIANSLLESYKNEKSVAFMPAMLEEGEKTNITGDDIQDAASFIPIESAGSAYTRSSSCVHLDSGATSDPAITPEPVAPKLIPQEDADYISRSTLFNSLSCPELSDLFLEYGHVVKMYDEAAESHDFDHPNARCPMKLF